MVWIPAPVQPVLNGNPLATANAGMVDLSPSGTGSPPAWINTIQEHVDLLLIAPVAPTSGVSKILQNIGKTRTTV